MKLSFPSFCKLAVAGVVGVAAGPARLAAQSAFYNGGTYTVDRPIDAASFVNAGTFNVFTGDVFSTRNTLTFVNQGDITAFLGFEMLTVGSTGSRRRAVSIQNAQGASLSALGSQALQIGVFPEGQGYTFGEGGYLNLFATSIVNRGQISVSYWGDLAVDGSSVDLRRSTLLTLSPDTTDQTRVVYINPPQVHVGVNPAGVRSQNWGFYSTRVALDSFATPSKLTETFPTPDGPVSVVSTNADINVSYISSTTVPPTDPASDPTGWRRISLATTPGTTALAYIQTNKLSSTNNSINAVFVINRNPNVIVSATVGGTQPLQAKFGYTVTNNTDGSVDFRSVVLTESWTQAYPTNAPYARDYNFANAMLPAYVSITVPPSLRIPISRQDRQFLGNPLDPRNLLSRSNLMVLLGEPASGANASFTPKLFTDGYFDLITNSLPYTNVVSTNDYMSYQFSLTSLPSQIPSPANSSFFGFGGNLIGGFGALIPEIGFVTNLAGRVRIEADNLDLRDTRVRAGGVVRVNARNVTTTRNTSIAAPYAWYDLGSTNGTLVYQGLNPVGQPNLNGTVRMMVMAWTNTVDFPDPRSTDTNTVTTAQGATFFRVMVVDANFQPLQTDGELIYLKLRATNLTTVDPVRFTIPDPDLISTLFPSVDPAAVVAPGVEQVAPITRNWINQSDFSVSGNIGVTSRSFPSLRTLVNSGNISAARVDLGSGTGASPLDGIINSGAINSGGLLSLSGSSFTNTGALSANNVLSLTADSLNLAGAQVNISAGGRLTIAGGTLDVASGGAIATPGILVINVTNRLNAAAGFVDGPPLLTLSGRGVELSRNAYVNDLSGVNVQVAAGRFESAYVAWSGVDRGTEQSGFANNSAVGALALDVDEFGLVEIRAAGSTPAALYVRRLELGSGFNEFITNGVVDFDGLATALDIAPDIRVYYNVVTVNGLEIKGTLLDGAFDGRLRLINSAGATGGGVTLDLGGGFSVTAPWALRYSATLDSDGDGIVNAADRTPFSGAVVSTQVVQLNGRPYFEIAWSAAAQTAYRIMVNEPSSGPEWSLLSSMSNSSATAKTLKFYDPMDRGSGAKTYRVVYMP
jgi:hypothetical protein